MTMSIIWPFCEGDVERPQDHLLFLAQKPYLPLGSLRQALYYPQIVSTKEGQLIDREEQKEAALASSGSAPHNLDDQIDTPTTVAPLATHQDPYARAVLEQVQLGHLIDRLDEVNDWSRILSLGEQQRLAFGRLMLARPHVAFLDEATSAMDEGLEDAMYRLIHKHIPDSV